jgi:pimeloyl-ACP methyl ester carboxylesterase
MFYKIRGTSDPAKVPVVLLHGALSATGSSFGTLPDLVARTRQVITVEQQGHGRTADIDRPMPVQAMADDTLALLASLGIGPGRPFGYSLGAGIALNIITNHPAVVRKAVLASVTYDQSGLHPEMFGRPGSGESAGGAGRRFRQPMGCGRSGGRPPGWCPGPAGIAPHRGWRAESGAGRDVVDGLVGGLQEPLGQGEPLGEQPLVRGGAGGFPELPGEVPGAERAARGPATLASRLLAETVAADGVVISPPMVAAAARTDPR